MATFHRHPRVYDCDAITCFEPCYKEYQHTAHSLLEGRFKMVFGTCDEARVRVCIFVNYRNALDSWKVAIYNPGLITLTIQTDIGPVDIHTAYHSYSSRQASHLDTSPLPYLEAAMQEVEGENIAIGDVNLHHLAWCGPAFNHQLNHALELENS